MLVKNISSEGMLNSKIAKNDEIGEADSDEEASQDVNILLKINH